jgi:hypothetical protein
MVVYGPNASAHIHTESTLSNSPLSTKGTIALGDGDVTHQLVLGPAGKVLFAFDIMLTPVSNDSQAVSVRVKPRTRITSCHNMCASSRAKCLRYGSPPR